MHWISLARAEIRTLLSSWGVWLLALILPIWMFRPHYAAGESLGADLTVGYLQYLGSLLVPLAVVFLGYATIAGERETGRIKMLLGLPMTRNDIIVGKAVGQGIGIGLPILVSVVIVTLIGLLRHGLFSPLRYIAVIGAAILYFGALVCIVVSISALFKRARQAAAVLVIGVVLVIELTWRAVVNVFLSTIRDAGLIGTDTSLLGFQMLLLRLTPSGAFHVLTNWILGIGNSANNHTWVLRESQPNVSTPALVAELVFSPGEIPLYLHEAGAILVLIMWIVLPVFVALSMFNRGDLV